MVDSDGLIPVHMYTKKIDADNNGIFAIVKVDGTDTEIQLFPVPE